MSQTVLKEPDHDTNDAVLQCVLILKERKFRFDIKIPGLEGNIMASQQTQPVLSSMVIRALRATFGTKVDYL